MYMYMFTVYIEDSISSISMPSVYSAYMYRVYVERLLFFPWRSVTQFFKIQNSEFLRVLNYVWPFLIEFTISPTVLYHVYMCMYCKSLLFITVV